MCNGFDCCCAFHCVVTFQIIVLDKLVMPFKQQLLRGHCCWQTIRHLHGKNLLLLDPSKTKILSYSAMQRTSLAVGKSIPKNFWTQSLPQHETHSSCIWGEIYHHCSRCLPSCQNDSWFLHPTASVLRNPTSPKNLRLPNLGGHESWLMTQRLLSQTQRTKIGFMQRVHGLANDKDGIFAKSSRPGTLQQSEETWTS